MNNTFCIGYVISFYRNSAGLTQNELSENICSPRYLSKIENGECSPTIFILDKISLKLGINVCSHYFDILRHYNTEVHDKINELNFYFNAKDIYNIYPLIKECDSMIGFQSGEPYLVLSYAKSLYYSCVGKDYNYSINIASESLSKSGFNFSMHKWYSNVELCLLLHLASDYNRINDFNNSRRIFDFLINYLYHNGLSNCDYFNLKILSKTLYIFFLAFPNLASSYQDIYDSLITTMTKGAYCFSLPELFLCNAKIKYDAADYKAYNKLLNNGLSLSRIYYGQEKTTQICKNIWGDLICNITL